LAHETVRERLDLGGSIDCFGMDSGHGHRHYSSQQNRHRPDSGSNSETLEGIAERQRNHTELSYSHKQYHATVKAQKTHREVSENADLFSVAASGKADGKM